MSKRLGLGFLVVLIAGGCNRDLVEVAAVDAGCPNADPSALAGRMVGNAVRLTWQSEATNAEGYVVERQDPGGWLQRAKLDAAAREFDDDLVSADTEYTFRVKAFVQSCESAPAQAQIFTAPQPPSAPVATAMGTDTVELQWTDPNDLEAGHRIERRDVATGDSGLVVINLPADAVRYVDSGLAGDTTYEYRVFAVSAAGDLSAAASTTVLTLPLAPASLVAAADSTVSIALSWTDANGSEDAYRVERLAMAGTYSIVATLAANTEQYVDTGLAPDSSHTYRVFAVNPSGDSAPAEATTATPLVPLVDNFVAIADDERVVLTWDLPVDPSFVGVRILRTSTHTPTAFDEVPPIYEGSDTLYLDTNVTNGVLYYYAAFSFDAVPNYSDPLGATAQPADVAPPAPVTALMATPGLGVVSLVWQNPVDADFAGVDVVRSALRTPADVTDGTVVYSGSATTHDDTSVANGITYYYAVFARDEVPNHSPGAAIAATPTSGGGDTTPPAPVSGLVAVAKADRILLAWQDPADVDFTGSRVVRRDDVTPASPTDGTLVYDGAAGFVSDPVAGGTTYHYAVFAHDGVPNYAAAIAVSATPGVDTTPPSDVGLFTASQVATNVALSWAPPPEPDYQGVEILRRDDGSFPAGPGDPLAVVAYDGQGTSHVDTGLSVGVTYYYAAYAYDDDLNYATGVTALATPSDWRQLATGAAHVAGVRADGTLWAWGHGGGGRLGMGDTLSRATMEQVGTDTDWASVGAGYDHTLALRTDGSLWAWGDNSDGELGQGDWGTGTNHTTPVGVGSDLDWAEVVACADYSLALKTDGSLWVWGDNLFEQLALGDTSDRYNPTQMGVDTDWAIVTCPADVAVFNPNRADHVIAIKTDGSLWAWGDNNRDQLGLGPGAPDPVGVPTAVGAQTSWVEVAAGGDYTLARRQDGTLWAWGYNGFGTHGDGGVTPKDVPTRIGSHSDWASIAAGSTAALGLKSNGAVFVWGNNTYGELGLGNRAGTGFPEQMGADTDWAVIQAAGQFILGTRPDGTLWTWGRNLDGRLGLGAFATAIAPRQVGAASNWLCGGARSTTVVLRDEGGGNRSLWTWGENWRYTAALGYLRPVAAGVQVPGDWETASVGLEHGAGIAGDGTLWGWGYEFFGRVGNGSSSTGFQRAPVLIDAGTTWTEVRAGADHTLARTSDGALWSWGWGNAGRLGHGSASSFTAPTQIGMDLDWATAAAGGAHSLAVKAGGTLWAWGENGAGQLGNNGIVDSDVPIQIGADTDWAAVYAGDIHSLGRKTDDSLWAWGSTTDDQLGTGIPAERREPRQVCMVYAGSCTTPLPAIRDAAAGDQHSLAVLADGTLWAWGTNGSGQLGNGVVGSTDVPVQVGTDNDWDVVIAGAFHSLAVKLDGTLWAWGNNADGQLGDGWSFVDVPTEVTGL